MRGAGDFEREINLGIMSIDLREFAPLVDALERLEDVRTVIASLLNELGFQWRAHIVDFLRQGMIIRSPGFLRSRMYVEKTRPAPIDHMATRVGSLFARGKAGAVTFDGLAYAMGIKHPHTRTRTLALLARGGEKTARARTSGKLMAGTDIPSTDDFPVVHGNRVLAFIRHMNESAPNKPFIIKAGYGFKPGLYRIKRGQSMVLRSGRSSPAIQIVQHFGREPESKRWMWLPESMHWIVQHAPLATMWQTAIERIIKHK